MRRRCAFRRCNRLRLAACPTCREHTSEILSPAEMEVIWEEALQHGAA